MKLPKNIIKIYLRLQDTVCQENDNAYAERNKQGQRMAALALDPQILLALFCAI